MREKERKCLKQRKSSLSPAIIEVKRQPGEIHLVTLRFHSSL